MKSAIGRVQSHIDALQLAYKESDNGNTVFPTHRDDFHAILVTLGEIASVLKDQERRIYINSLNRGWRHGYGKTSSTREDRST